VYLFLLKEVNLHFRLNQLNRVKKDNQERRVRVLKNRRREFQYLRRKQTKVNRKVKRVPAAKAESRKRAAPNQQVRVKRNKKRNKLKEQPLLPNRRLLELNLSPKAKSQEEQVFIQKKNKI